MRKLRNRIIHWHMGQNLNRFACVIPDESIKITIRREERTKGNVWYTAQHNGKDIPYSTFKKLKLTQHAAALYVDRNCNVE